MNVVGATMKYLRYDLLECSKLCFTAQKAHLKQQHLKKKKKKIPPWFQVR